MANEEPFGIEQFQRAQATGNLAVEPSVQALALGGAGQLAQEVLIARCLSVVVVLVVETGAGQGHIPGLRVGGFATSQFWPQGVDQTARAQDAREGMMTLGAMELQTDLAGEIEPDGNFLFFSRRGVGVSQTLKDLPVDELPKEISLERFPHMFQVIDLAASESLQDEGPVVFKGQQMH